MLYLGPYGVTLHKKIKMGFFNGQVIVLWYGLQTQASQVLQQAILVPEGGRGGEPHSETCRGGGLKDRLRGLPLLHGMYVEDRLASELQHE